MLPELQQVQQTDISMFQKRMGTVLFGVSELNINIPSISLFSGIYIFNQH